MEETKTELQLIKLSEIESQEVSWLWFPFISYGKLTIVQGDPGDGKTTFVLNIAAKLTKGLEWEIPAGRIEDGESKEDAARRECMEETGCTVKDLKLLCPIFLW